MLGGCRDRILTHEELDGLAIVPGERCEGRPEESRGGLWPQLRYAAPPIAGMRDLELPARVSICGKLSEPSAQSIRIAAIVNRPEVVDLHRTSRF
jgi:hypothetical protein